MNYKFGRNNSGKTAPLDSPRLHVKLKKLFRFSRYSSNLSENNFPGFPCVLANLSPTPQEMLTYNSINLLKPT